MTLAAWFPIGPREPDAACRPAGTGLRGAAGDTRRRHRPWGPGARVRRRQRVPLRRHCRPVLRRGALQLQGQLAQLAVQYRSCRAVVLRADRPWLVPHMGWGDGRHLRPGSHLVGWRRLRRAVPSGRGARHRVRPHGPHRHAPGSPGRLRRGMAGRRMRAVGRGSCPPGRSLRRGDRAAPPHRGHRRRLGAADLRSGRERWFRPDNAHALVPRQRRLSRSRSRTRDC